MKKVSVIIPVYNVEEYLEECMESVIHQTLKEIEILCVNDGSTDHSLQILEQYAKKDDRIRIISQKNGGYGKAMNQGLDAASGEYIGIVEPDDYVPLNMYEDLYKKAKEYELDFVKADFYRFVTAENGNKELYYNHLSVNPEDYNHVFNPSEKPDAIRFIMNTWSGIYRREFLEQHKIQEARLDAWLLLEYAANINRAWYYAHMDEILDKKTESRYLEMCAKRAQHIPLQHITGRAYFMGYEFCVDERVLVPRQDTEVLVETALTHLKDSRSPKVLDMCTGSGCILLSLLMERQDASGTGVDVSEGALTVAKQNRMHLQLENRAEFVQSDLFSGDYFEKNSGNTAVEYDMLISNPPYIPSGDIPGLMEEVRSHDPVLALDGKEDGLFFYREITAQAEKYLRAGGWLMYEIGCDQGESVPEIMKANDFVNVEVIQDLSGLDRVVIGQKK